MSLEESKNKRIKLTNDADNESVIVVKKDSKDDSKDDSEKIQTELNKISESTDKKKIVLIGDFILAQTIYLPSNFTWVVEGKITLSYHIHEDESKGGFDRVKVEYPMNDPVTNEKVTNSRLVAIALMVDKDTMSKAENQATNITMRGGTYDGGIDPIANPVHESDKTNNETPVRFISLSNVTNSTFRDMEFQYTSNDALTLHYYANNNVVRNVNVRKSHQNGLADKGEYNKWYNCLVEDCRSDGWVPKSRYSEYHQCISRRNGGPGFGLFARIDAPEENDIGAQIVGNKFYEIESYENRRAGLSANSADKCPGSEIKDNYIQGKFYNNGMYGISFRNKDPDSKHHDNEIHIISYGNRGVEIESKEFLKLGFEADTTDLDMKGGGIGFRLDGDNIKKVTGAIVCYDNAIKGGYDMDISQGKKCSLIAFKKAGKDAKIRGADKNGNQIEEKEAPVVDHLFLLKSLM